MLQQQTDESSMAKYSLLDNGAWYSQWCRYWFVQLGAFIDFNIFVSIDIF